jgi:hypothetical protein
VLRKVLENNTAAVEQRIAKTLAGSCQLLSCDPFGSHIIQRLLETTDLHIVNGIAGEIQPHLLTLATNIGGCHVLHKLMLHSTSSAEQIVASISANSVILAKDKYGTFVVQSALSVNAEAIAEVLFEAGVFSSLCCHQFGTYTMQKLVRGGSSSVISLSSTRAELDYKKLCTNRFGLFFMEVLLKNKHCSASLKECIRKNAQALCTTAKGKKLVAIVDPQVAKACYLVQNALPTSSKNPTRTRRPKTRRTLTGAISRQDKPRTGIIHTHRDLQQEKGDIESKTQIETEVFTETESTETEAY